MSGVGIIWAMIICIPFWLTIVFIIKGIIAGKTLIYVGVALSALLVPLIAIFSHNAKQNKSGRNIIIENSHIPTVQPKTRPHDSFGGGTPG
jgi:hypothetical protein